MITTLADQYLAQNAGRRYPIADDAGYDVISDDSAILDFRCTVLGVGPGISPRAWITSVTNTGSASGKTIVVTVDRPGTHDVLSFDIPGNMAADTYVSAATDARTGAVGTLTVSPSALTIPLDEISNDIAEPVPLAWNTVVCDSLKVDSVQSAQDAEDAIDKDDPAGITVTTAISGDIEIEEGRNTEPYLDGNRLRLDIFKGGGLGERCQSAVMGGQRCDTVLFTINGERPGSDGDLRIVGESGVAIKPIPEEHAIEITMDDATAGLMSEGCAPECSEA